MKIIYWSYLLLSFCILCVSCKENPTSTSESIQPYKQVKVENTFECNCSIRALDVNEKSVFFAGSNGVYGYLDTDDLAVKYIDSIEVDGEKPEFRGLARTATADFILGVDDPAYIYKVNPSGEKEMLFRQDEKGTFFDAMAFWNEQEGMIIGDPTVGCMAFSITRDGGDRWDPVSCDKIGKSKEGEAAFAASNSNIAVVGDSTWVLSGGKTSRVYFSPDKGENWEVFDTPLIAGENTTGGYTIDFYDDRTGIIFGGDYTHPARNSRNKAVTRDGGKTWHVVADEKEPGYKSSVRYIPKGGGKEIVAAGFTGISYSSDAGKTWQKISDEEFYTLRFLNDSIAYAAGNGRVAKLYFQ